MSLFQVIYLGCLGIIALLALGVTFLVLFSGRGDDGR